MPLVYATETELATYTGDPAPANAARLLREASALVRRHTVTWIYDTDSAGKPSDPDLADAFRDATCAQAEAWDALGVDPVGGPANVAGAVTSAGIGSGRVTREARAGQGQDRADTVTALVPSAAAILDDAAYLADGRAVRTY